MNQITQQNLGGGGRLGNQLFGIACVLSLAKKLNADPVFSQWEYSKYFKNPLPSGEINPTHHYHEPHFHFTPIELGEAVAISDLHSFVADRKEGKCINLHGYFQSEKYFDDCTRIIREQFHPGEGLISKLKQKYGTAFHGETCSIHIRRGDYVNNPYYADLVSSGYYQRAISYLKSGNKISKFFIFSDDIEWCKSHFNGDSFEYIEGNSDIEDLFLMASCAHNIGANSSFSFWGNYLNNYPYKISIFPKEWFGPTGAHLDTKDLYLKNWITL